MNNQTLGQFIKSTYGMTVKEWADKNNLRAGTAYAQWKVGKCYLGKNTLGTNHPLLKTYFSMLDRCYRYTHKDYHSYGGRGIRVCPEWFYSFDQFVLDMGEKPGSGYSIDRIDNNGNYSKANCRWATSAEQLQNTRIAGRTTGELNIVSYTSGKRTYYKVKLQRNKKRTQKHFKTMEEAIEFRDNLLEELDG